jgi:hypothetical protein
MPAASITSSMSWYLVVSHSNCIDSNERMDVNERSPDASTHAQAECVASKQGAQEGEGLLVPSRALQPPVEGPRATAAGRSRSPTHRCTAAWSITPRRGSTLLHSDRETESGAEWQRVTSQSAVWPRVLTGEGSPSSSTTTTATNVSSRACPDEFQRRVPTD